MGCCLSSEPQEEGGRKTGGDQHWGPAFPQPKAPRGCHLRPLTSESLAEFLASRLCLGLSGTPSVCPSSLSPSLARTGASACLFS